jgi:hypothetical protein
MTRRPRKRWRATHRAELLFAGDAHPTVIEVYVDPAGMAWGEGDSAPMLALRGHVWHMLAGGTLQMEPRVTRIQPGEWPQSALSRLGYVADSVIARDLGITASAVQQRRVQMGIPACGAPTSRPARGSTATATLQMRLTPAERERFEAAAGEEPISAWGRRILRRESGMDS